MWMAGPSSRAI